MSFINTPIIIGIDHGYGNIKTAHCCFKTGVTEYDKEPTFKSGLLTWGGRYFLIGEEHKEFAADKMGDLDYYVLTLAAIARELAMRDMTSARVHLAAGLPLTWVSDQKERFKAYLLQNDRADFTFRGVDYHEWIALLTDFIQRQFVEDGMCADMCIHDTDGHNPHAHIMLTVRPLDEKGKWQYKTEKEYLCVRNGEERGFTAAEFKAARAGGWEKQYPYMVDGKKAYMAPSEAEAHGYERVSKYPKSTKYGRQNPIAARWNSDEQLNLWRAAWADAVNLCLERKGLDERIDHRSHAERGLDEQPSIHEGVTARALEKKGITSDRCEINRQIKADNALLRGLKAQVRKLMQAVRATIPAMAEAMEKLRENMIVFRYQLRHISYGKGRLSRRLGTVRSALERYSGLVHQIKEKGKERKTFLAEKKATPKLRVTRHRELSALITGLTEELEELRSQKAMLLRELACRDDSEIGAVKKDIAGMEADFAKLDQQEQKCAAELNDALKQYAELKEQAKDLDSDELLAARQALRPEMERSAAARLQAAYGDEFKAVTLYDSKLDVRDMLGERTQQPRKIVDHQQKRGTKHRELER